MARNTQVLKIDINKISGLLAANKMQQNDMFKNGLSRGTYSGAIRKGYARPLTIKKIADSLGVDIEEIIERA